MDDKQFKSMVKILEKQTELLKEQVSLLEEIKINTYREGQPKNLTPYKWYETFGFKTEKEFQNVSIYAEEIKYGVAPLVR